MSIELWLLVLGCCLSSVIASVLVIAATMRSSQISRTEEKLRRTQYWWLQKDKHAKVVEMEDTPGLGPGEH